MKVIKVVSNSIPNRFLLLVLALFGIAFILFSTNNYGVGLSPDSVVYIGTSRNIANGVGIVTYNGISLVHQPPFYPILLAFSSLITRTDPLIIANIVNAFLFGLIVFLGGFLMFKYLSSFTFAFIGTLSIIFSAPLFNVSTMAWTEPLFISLVLLSIIFINSYLETNQVTLLIIFTLTVALSTLTRYIGVTLILWGAMIVLSFHENSKNRRNHLTMFVLISAMPLGLWFIRNYIINNTFIGSRAPSSYTLYQNISYLFNTILDWYIPDIITDNRSILMVFIIGVGLFTGVSLRNSWKDLKVRLQQRIPIVLFIIIYTSFLILSSTTTAYDQINDRLLSPIYVPLTLLMLTLAEGVVAPYRKIISRNVVNSLIVISMTIWLIYPILSTMINAINLIQNGRGYNSKAWINSEIVEYLVQQQLKTECTFYSNAPDAVYILAGLQTKISPAKRRYNSPEIINNIQDLSGSWPQQNNACLVWFDNNIRSYLFTVDELKEIADIDPIVILDDGIIYSITKK